jgi:hypothetical protein
MQILKNVSYLRNLKRQLFVIKFIFKLIFWLAPPINVNSLKGHAKTK